MKQTPKEAIGEEAFDRIRDKVENMGYAGFNLRELDRDNLLIIINQLIIKLEYFEEEMEYERKNNSIFSLMKNNNP